MKKFICALGLSFFFILNAFAQEKTYNDSAISAILHNVCINIGAKLLENAKQGKIKAYSTDSLDKTISLADLNKLTQNLSNTKVVNGLETFFSNKSTPESINQNLQLAGIAPLYNPDINGIALPQQPLCFFSFADMEKVLAAEDVKLVVILSNLLFSTHNLYNTFNIGAVEERQKQDIDNFISNQVYVNIYNMPHRVFFTQENIKILATNLIHEIADVYFSEIMNYKNGRFSYNFDNIYEDAQLKNQYTQKRWKELNQFCETVTVSVGNDEDMFVDSTICTEFDYYSIDKLILSPTAFGLGVDFSKEFGGNKIRVFTQRKNPLIHLPSWLDFIIFTYLK